MVNDWSLLNAILRGRQYGIDAFPGTGTDAPDPAPAISAILGFYFPIVLMFGSHVFRPVGVYLGYSV